MFFSYFKEILICDHYNKMNELYNKKLPNLKHKSLEILKLPSRRSKKDFNSLFQVLFIILASSKLFHVLAYHPLTF